VGCGFHEFVSFDIFVYVDVFYGETSGNNFDILIISSTTK
jgi:hypothetical protein